MCVVRNCDARNSLLQIWQVKEPPLGCTRRICPVIWRAVALYGQLGHLTKLASCICLWAWSDVLVVNPLPHSSHKCSANEKIQYWGLVLTILRALSYSDRQQERKVAFFQGFLGFPLLASRWFRRLCKLSSIFLSNTSGHLLHTKLPRVCFSLCASISIRVWTCRRQMSHT